MTIQHFSHSEISYTAKNTKISKHFTQQTEDQVQIIIDDRVQNITYLGADLVAALTRLQVHNLPHLGEVLEERGREKTRGGGIIRVRTP